MDIFDKLFGKAKFREDDLLVEVAEGNSLILVDRDSYEYARGIRTGSDPSQTDLDEILKYTTTVHVYAGGTCRGKRIGPHKIAEIAGPEVIGDLASALQIRSDPETFGHCGCLGGPSLELFGGQKMLATLAIHHGRTLRWDRWRPDATFLQPQAITYWLVKHGVHYSLLDLLYRNEYLTLGTVPKSLTPPTRILPIIEQLHLLAEGLRSTGDMESAAVVCDLLLRDFPVSWRAYFTRALVRLVTQDYPGCIADCDMGLGQTADPASRAELLVQRGMARPYLGAHEEAVSDFTAALGQKSDCATAYFNRAAVRASLGQLTEALSDNQEAVRLSPDHAAYREGRAHLLFMNGDDDGCVRDCDLLIDGRLRPAAKRIGYLAHAHFWRGKALERIGEAIRSQADLSEARKLHEELVEFLERSLKSSS